MRRRWSVGLSLLALGLICVVGGILWQALEFSSLTTVSVQVEQLKPVAGVIRLLLIGMLVALWPRLVDLAIHYWRIDAIDRSQLRAFRWRAVAWLLIIELLIGQDLFGRFLSVTSGSVA